MTPLEFIASLPHGEAKAAALTVFNLMTPVWIEITDDPATLPEKGQTVIVRHVNGYEMFGCLESCWYQSSLASWSKGGQQIEENLLDESETPTHWRLI